MLATPSTRWTPGPPPKGSNERTLLGEACHRGDSQQRNPGILKEAFSEPPLLLFLNLPVLALASFEFSLQAPGRISQMVCDRLHRAAA
jgi:hypothetical protein